jgi:Zn-dependent protease with chaperone function
METVLVEDVSAVQEQTDEVTAGELKAALEGVLPRRRISVFYQAGLVLVAVFMVLLPLAYLAFAAFAAYCTYWYAVHAWVLFSGSPGGIHLVVFKAILYLGPIVGGIVAFFFMFKPLLARSPKRAEPIELNPAHHPRLYQFIAHLSDGLRVSMPKRIYLDCDLNASAGLRRGWMSFLGHDLVLTLGLPLIAGLNTRQFAAVVAHELGHCTQGLAMRLGFIIDSIDRWFLRVVYERDTWDEALDDWSNSTEDWRLSLVVACAHLAVWLSRKVLTLLMMLGHAASCFLSRQMEFHADACAMGVAGSGGLESLLIRLRELTVLEHLAYGALHQIWQKRHQLPDNVPDFLEQLERRVPAGFHDQTRQTLLNETAGFFATHPTACQRIQKARQRAQPGIFGLERPARALFNDFAGTARLVTGRHYRQTLRLAVTNPMLKPVTDFFQEVEGQRTRAVALK